MNKSIKAALAAVILCAVTAPAQDYFSLTGTAQAGTNSYAIVPRKTGFPCLYFLEARVRGIDQSNGVSFVSYTSGVGQKVTRAGTTGTNTIYLASSNGWAVGDALILERNQGNAYERHTVSAVTSTNITISGTTAGLTTTDALVYRVTAGPSILHSASAAVALQNASLRVVGSEQPILSGAESRPWLLEMQGTATNALLAVSGRWLAPTLGK